MCLREIDDSYKGSLTEPPGIIVSGGVEGEPGRGVYWDHQLDWRVTKIYGFYHEYVVPCLLLVCFSCWITLVRHLVWAALTASTRKKFALHLGMKDSSS